MTVARGSSSSPRDSHKIPGPRSIERADHSSASSVEDMRVDHGRLHALMSEELLNGSNVVPIFQQVCRERMTKRVRGHPFREPDPKCGLANGLLHYRLVEVVSVPNAGLRVGVVGSGRKYPLPRPIAIGQRVLPGKCGGEWCTPEPARKVGSALFEDAVEMTPGGVREGMSAAA